MSIEVNHLIVPATDKRTSAKFLADILGIQMGEPVSHFQPVQVGTVTLDYDDAADIRPLHIAFLVDDATFEAAHERLLDSGVTTYADPGRSRPRQINHRYGGRGVYFDDPDRHLFAFMTAANRPEVGSQPLNDAGTGHGCSSTVGSRWSRAARGASAPPSPSCSPTTGPPWSSTGEKRRRRPRSSLNPAERRSGPLDARRSHRLRPDRSHARTHRTGARPRRHPGGQRRRQPGPARPIEQLTEAEWRQSVDVNLTATFLTIKAFLPGMKEHGRGNIITMSSAAARRPTAQSPTAYAAAKAGIEVLTKSLALQAGPPGSASTASPQKPSSPNATSNKSQTTSKSSSASSIPSNGSARPTTSPRPPSTWPQTAPAGSAASPSTSPEAPSSPDHSSTHHSSTRRRPSSSSGCLPRVLSSTAGPALVPPVSFDCPLILSDGVDRLPGASLQLKPCRQPFVHLDRASRGFCDDDLANGWLGGRRRTGSGRPECDGGVTVERWSPWRDLRSGPEWMASALARS